jgi:hypothetical protein
MSWLTGSLARVSVPVVLASMVACGGGGRPPATPEDAAHGSTGDTTASDSTNQDDTKANYKAFLGEPGQAQDSAAE